MNTSTIIPLTALVLTSLTHVCAAGDLLDAPGPGYFQQIERLRLLPQPVTQPKTFGWPVIQIHPVSSATSLEPLADREQTFSKPIQLFQQSPTLISSGVLKVVPTPRK